MYRVVRQGNVVNSYDLFVDAWLHLYLGSCWGRIVGPNNMVWTVNPPIAN